MMSGMEKIKHILENEVHILESKYVKTLEAPNGIVDSIEMDIHKSLAIVEELDNLNHLVSTKQDYPLNDMSTVTFTTDMVVMDGKDYRELISLLYNEREKN